MSLYENDDNASYGEASQGARSYAYDYDSEYQDIYYRIGTLLFGILPGVIFMWIILHLFFCHF